jgi:hypothetical protein
MFDCSSFFMQILFIYFYNLFYYYVFLIIIYLFYYLYINFLNKMNIHVVCKISKKTIFTPASDGISKVINWPAGRADTRSR